MKLKKYSFLFFALACLNIISAQKVGHLNLDSLINNMAETKTAQQVIDKLRKDLEQEVITMQTEFETKVQDFQAKENTYTEPVKQSKITSLQQLQKRIEDFKNDASAEIQKKYAELTAPIVDKAKKAIDAVAKENGYKYILDTSVGNVLYSEATDDVYSTVLKKLATIPVIQLPGTKTEEKKTPAKTPGKTAPAKGK